MSAAPLIADFAIRLAFGLTTALLLTSWRVVPLRFFRIQNLVILGVLVLGGLDHARFGASGLAFGLVASGALLAYVASVAWGLGLPTIGISAGLLTSLDTFGWLALASRSDHAQAWTWVLEVLNRSASGFLVGTTLTAMLLGHYYLTAPTMTIEPLKRAVRWIAFGLLARCFLAGIGVYVWSAAPLGLATDRLAVSSRILLGARWGIGFVGTAMAVYLTWKTVQIRSTQSATGILYIATILVCFGELIALIQAAELGGLS
jgi:hypothetical protein